MDTIIILELSLGLLTFWLVILTIMVAKEKQFLRDLGKGVVKKDLISILKQHNSSLNIASQTLEKISQKVDKIESANKLHFQKMGFIRFNPFSDTGGDQSFSLCLLDQDNNGIVISSLHTRNTTRLYAKEVVVDGMNQADYSQEEWKAYQAAKDYRRK